jgi:hypothetical protein
MEESFLASDTMMSQYHIIHASVYYIYMSTKHSIAQSKKWLHIGKEKRTEIMSLLAKKRWSNKTIKEKREHSKKMLLAKLNKKTV